MESDARAEAERRSGHIASPARKNAYRDGFIAGAEWRESRVKALEAAIGSWVQLRDRLFDSNWSYDRHLNAAEERVIAEWRALINPGQVESPQASGAESQSASTAAKEPK